MDQSPKTRLLTLEQAAERLAITTSHLRSLTSGGAIRSVNLSAGRKRKFHRYTEADIEQFIQDRTQDPGPQVTSDDAAYLRLLQRVTRTSTSKR
jgi:excisionase family DNA binding protein